MFRNDMVVNWIERFGAVAILHWTPSHYLKLSVSLAPVESQKECLIQIAKERKSSERKLLNMQSCNYQKVIKAKIWPNFRAKMSWQYGLSCTKSKSINNIIIQPSLYTINLSFCVSVLPHLHCFPHPSPFQYHTQLNSQMDYFVNH